MGYDSDHAAVARRGRAGAASRSSSLRGHGDAVRRHPDGRGLDLDDDQRPGADPARVLHRLRREARASTPTKLRGTVQNDILKEYQAQHAWLFPPEPSLRMITDVMALLRRARAAVEHDLDLAATTSARPARRRRRSWPSRWPTASSTCERGIARGLDVDDFAPRLSFFFNSHLDFFEEIAKFRAARRIWARKHARRVRRQGPALVDAALPHADRRRAR